MSKAARNPEAYRTVAFGDLASLIDPPRYGERSGSFDEMIAASERHYWNPADPRYLNFHHPFDPSEQLILPAHFTPELATAVADRLPKERLTEFGNQLVRFHLSQLLHGEQGGVALSANLCGVFRDPGAQEYAANQVREETRHVRALSKYIECRWGAPAAADGPITRLMANLVTTQEVYQKIIGMQIMIEGLALGVFATMLPATTDPVLARLLKLLIADESYHHRFGKMWGLTTIPQLNEAQHQQVENWAAGCFLTVTQNVAGAQAKREIYEQYGLDWKWVQGALSETYNTPQGRRELAQGNGIFRILVKTLVQTGIITARTRPLYDVWFDLKQLENEAGESHEEAVAEEMAVELSFINRETRKA